MTEEEGKDEEMEDTVGNAENAGEDEGSGRSPSQTPLINRAHVKEFALGYCSRSSKVYVRTKMKRVSEDFMVALNAAVREWIRKRVDGQASTGMTLR